MDERRQYRPVVQGRPGRRQQFRQEQRYGGGGYTGTSGYEGYSGYDPGYGAAGGETRGTGGPPAGSGLDYGRYTGPQRHWQGDFNPYGDSESWRWEQGPYRGALGYRDQLTERARDEQRARERRGPKGYQRSDERLREDISERLMHDDRVDCSEVSVQVQDGKVTLEGTVPERYMKHAIEDLTDACPGVQDIDNRIRVQAGEPRPSL